MCLLCYECAFVFTGESEGVPKKAEWLAGGAEEHKAETTGKKKEEALTDKNMAYMGCTVHDGRGKVRGLSRDHPGCFHHIL